MPEQPRRTPRENLTPVIVKEAATLFAERGFEATTMQDIAARVGITAPGLYYYFPSKQNLLFEVLESALENLLVRLEAAVQAARGDGGPRPPAELRAFTHSHVTFQIEEVEETAVYSSTFYGTHHMVKALSDAQRTRLRELQDRSFNLLRRILREGVDTGEFAIPELTTTAFAIIAIGEYPPSWFKPGGRLSADDLGALYADLALRMVGVPSPAAGIPPPQSLAESGAELRPGPIR